MPARVIPARTSADPPGGGVLRDRPGAARRRQGIVCPAREPRTANGPFARIGPPRVLRLSYACPTFDIRLSYGFWQAQIPQNQSPVIPPHPRRSTLCRRFRQHMYEVVASLIGRRPQLTKIIDLTRVRHP
jgi:hypothetical protein